MSGDGYEGYLARFERELGDREEGTYATWNGRLIRKLGRIEFEGIEAEYRALWKEFEEAVASNATLRDTTIRQLRERAAELVLDAPI